MLFILILFFAAACQTGANIASLKSQNFFQNPINSEILDTARNIQISEQKDKEIIQGISLYYQEALPPEGDRVLGEMLLLHEALQSSDVWAKTLGAPGPRTLQILAAAGYRAVAIDLPGFPLQKSLGSLPKGLSKSEFVQAVLKGLQLEKPIILSPTVSGSFASPFVADHPDEVAGFVAISACCADSRSNWTNVKTPILIVRGSRDPPLQREILSAPFKKIETISNARNGGYAESPRLLHRILLNFIQFLSENSDQMSNDLSTTTSTTEANLLKYNFDWEEVDFSKSVKNVALLRILPNIYEKTNIITLPGSVRLFYREVIPSEKPKSNTPILLFHDRFTTSRHWSSAKTLLLLASNGYRAVAVDLPGFGFSTGHCEQCNCMTKILNALNMTQPILISPEMSTDYVLPLLYNNPNAFGAILVTGYMTSQNNFFAEDFAHHQVPILAISDELSLKHYKVFGKMPNALILLEKKLSSRPYVNNLKEFHNILLKFVNRIFE